MSNIRKIYEKKLFERTEKLRALKKSKAYHIGVDPSTSRIVFATEFTATANSLNDINFKTSIHYSVNYAFINDSVLEIDQSTSSKEFVPRADSNFDATNCWKWKFSEGKMVPAEVPISQELIEQYKLILTMSFAIDLVHKKLRTTHRSINKDLPLQQTIYLLKREQATKVLEHNIIDPIQVPFVFQYAEIKGIDMRQAAQQIKFMSDDAMYRLIDAEKSRMTYVSMIKNCLTIEEIYHVLDMFDKENLHTRI